MILSWIENGFSGLDIKEEIVSLLLSIVPFLLALSLHEAAHAFVAHLCGDDTAKEMGRITVNPLRHLDPKGFLMMLLVGIGWAKPVPVNPRNFRHGRRDDFFVSMAGITMNLIMSLIGCTVCYCMVFLAIKNMPSSMRYYDIGFIYQEKYYLTYQDAYIYFYAMREELIAPVFGSIVGYLYEMIEIFAVVNLSLAIFNFLPVPPLDGYHFLNDLVLKKSFFAQQKTMLIGEAILLVLVLTGYLDDGLNFVIEKAFSGFGTVAAAIFGGMV